MVECPKRNENNIQNLKHKQKLFKLCIELKRVESERKNRYHCLEYFDLSVFYQIDMDNSEDNDIAHLIPIQRKELLEKRFDKQIGIPSIQEIENNELKSLEEKKLASDFKTFGNTFIAFVGAGILGLPYAFKKSGILLGLLTLIFTSFVAIYAMLLIVRCKYKLKKSGVEVRTYGEIGTAAYGNAGKITVNLALVISQTAFCIAYLIFIATNINSLFGIKRNLVIFGCIPVLVFLSYLRHLKHLAPFALLADFMNIIGLGVVYFKDFTYMPLDHDEIHYMILSNFSFFFGIASYCFEGVGMILPIENSMQHKENFLPILIGTVGLVTTIYATFGICGYLAFGDATKDVITLNISGTTTGKIVKFSLCVGLYFTYPMMLFPVYEVVEGYIKNSLKLKNEKIITIFRTFLVMFTAIAAIGIPNFGLFISFIGSTCCSLLAFILPPLFYLKICRDSINFLDHVFLIFIIAIGLVATVIGLRDAISHVT